MHLSNTLKKLWRQKDISSVYIAAAAAAKSLQLCATLCDPIDGSSLDSPVPGILQARTLEWVAISFSNAWRWKVKVKSLSHVWLLATPWTAAYQAPPSMGFSRQSTGVGCHCLLWMESLPIINPYTMSSAFTNLSFLFTLNWLDFVTQDFFKISWKLYLFWAHVLFILTGVSLLSNVV